ncbi:MAG: hypothetical protein ACYC35_22880 [Pirellulales bacterium]
MDPAQESARAELAYFCRRLDLAAEQERMEFHVFRATNPTRGPSVNISASKEADIAYRTLAREIEPLLVQAGAEYSLAEGRTPEGRLLNWVFASMQTDPIGGGSEGDAWEEHEENVFRLTSLAIGRTLAKIAAEPVIATDHTDARAKMSVNEQMAAVLAGPRKTEAVGWTAREFAEHLGCKKSAVGATDTWNALMRMREEKKMDRLSRQSNRTNSG